LPIGQLCRAIDAERKGKPSVMVTTEGDSDVDDFYKFFPNFNTGIKPTINPTSSDDLTLEVVCNKRLFKLSDASGKLEFSKIAEDTTISKDMLGSYDVYIFDIGAEVFAWVGNNASMEEKRSAMQFAMQYLKQHNRPLQIPITICKESFESESFLSAF
jgi:gelsolin